MLTGKVIVAYDGSTYSKVALEWALALQERLGVTVDVVTVLPPIGNLFMYADYPMDMTSVRESQKEGMVKSMELLLAECADKGRKVETHILEGHIVDTLIEHSVASGAELIVSGTRGAGGFEGLLIGSVAQKLVAYSKVPVLVVK